MPLPATSSGFGSAGLDRSQGRAAEGKGLGKAGLGMRGLSRPSIAL